MQLRSKLGPLSAHSLAKAAIHTSDRRSAAVNSAMPARARARSVSREAYGELRDQHSTAVIRIAFVHRDSVYCGGRVGAIRMEKRDGRAGDGDRTERVPPA